jgi:hypothetical protein
MPKIDAHLDERKLSLTELQDFLFKSAVPLEDLEDFKGEPLKKILFYWRKMELVPFIVKGVWYKPSFADLLWFKVLDILRQFSYPIDKVKKVVDYFFLDAYRNKVPEKNMKYNQGLLTKKKTAGTILEEEEHLLEQIKLTLAYGGLEDALYLRVNYFTNLIDSFLNDRQEKGILVFLDGSVAEYSGSHYYSHATREVDPLRPHIYISIKYLLEEFIQHKELSEILVQQLLNEEEKKVLQELKKKNLKELTIDLKDGRVTKIKSRSDGTITGEQARQIREILELKNYESITLDTMDEKSLFFKKIKKKV